MKSTPLFSVLIANHNDGRYLLDAINSVMAQTYNNWEIIIVDDYSIDNSKQLYNQYTNDPRFHIYFNEKNEGCGYTKRRCVELANGEICGFLDADDALVSGALEKMVNTHINHPNASLVYSNHFLCDKNLTITGFSVTSKAIPHNSSFLEIKNGAISHFATFKKDYYLKTEGISPFFHIAEDHDLYFKLEEVGSTVFVEEPLYYYRCNTLNNTSLGDNIVKASYWDILAIYEACKRRNISIEKNVFPSIEELIQSIVIDTRSKMAGEMINTKEYKLGSFLYKPIKKIKKIFKK